MKKSLLIALLSVCCLIELAAVDLLQYCPDDTFAAGYVDFAALRRHPQFDALLKEGEIKKELDELAGKFGSRVEEWNQGLIFGVTKDKDSFAGAILDIPVLNNLPMILAELKKAGKISKYSEKSIAGKKCFVVTEKEGKKENTIVIYPAAPGIVVCATDEDAETVLSMKSGNPAALRKQISELPDKNPAAWFTGDTLLPENYGNEELYKLRGIFKFSDDGKKYFLIGDIICPNADTSAGIHMLVSMYVGVANGIIFSQDQELGQEVRKCLTLKADKNVFKFKIETTQELILKVVSYVGQHSADMDLDQLGM